jgi:hypothetical protein
LRSPSVGVETNKPPPSPLKDKRSPSVVKEAIKLPPSAHKEQSRKLASPAKQERPLQLNEKPSVDKLSPKEQVEIKFKPVIPSSQDEPRYAPTKRQEAILQSVDVKQ